MIENISASWYTNAMDEKILGLYAEIKVLEQENLFRHFFMQLSKERQQKIENCKTHAGQLQSLGAWSLMNYGLQTCAGRCERDSMIAYGVHGKPYLRAETQIFFNLSHSGDYVLAVFAPVEVGCDIQKRVERTQNTRMAERFFTRQEQCAMKQGTDFFRIWARKESYLKWCGDGMARDLRSVDVTASVGMDGTCFEDMAFQDASGAAYVLAVCHAAEQRLPILWKKIDLKEVYENDGKTKGSKNKCDAYFGADEAAVYASDI